MLPGKKYTPEDALLILRRRFWWLIVPVAVVGAGAGIYARVQPNLYRSQTRIMVVPQRVPESYVRSTVTTRIEDRLGAISQQILSRTTLEAIVLEFDLYAKERQTMGMEDVVARMRQRDISVRPERGEAFVVSFIGREPRTVMRVTQRLASHFIDESLRDRQLLADGTNEFLESQLEDAKRRLMEHERKLQNYKERYAGQLPTQGETNLRSAQAIQAQVQSILDQISRDQERRLMMERQLADLELQLNAPAAAPQTPRTSQPEPAAAAAAPLIDQLTTAQRDLAALVRRGRKEEHPEHQRQLRLIRDLEARVDAAIRDTPVSVAAGPAPSGIELTRRRRISELRDDLNVIDRRIADLRDKEAQLRETAGEFQRRAEAGPSRESELVELTRDYGMLQQLYNGLLSNREQARIAANLEKRQIGERFRLLDPANLPQRPFSPNREQTVMFGTALGLGVGLGLIVLFEYRDRSVKTEEEASTVLALPVLAVVPFMRSKRELRRIRSRRLITHLVLGSSVAGCLIVLAYSLLA
jgi:polysaccharide chain length determinant protein (PEP-CTERM system associated)